MLCATTQSKLWPIKMLPAFTHTDMHTFTLVWYSAHPSYRSDHAAKAL